MSRVQNLCWLITILDYTTQYVEDYNTPIEGSLKTNQYKGMREEISAQSPVTGRATQAED